MKSKQSSSRFHIPEWLDLKVLAILVLLGLFLMAMSWSEPQPKAHKVAGILRLDQTIVPPTETPTPPGTNTAAPAAAQPSVKPTRTRTPIPQEWVDNREMANGIILGAVVLVLIIVGGTLVAIRHK